MTPDAVVVVPARDERDLVGAAVTALRASVRRAQLLGLVGRVAVEVTAHRCTDDTAEVARAASGATPGWRVTEDQRSDSVGRVRDLAVRRGLADLAAEPERTWVLSTDADTRVGDDWVASILRTAASTGAEAVVGLAHLDRWHGGPSGARAYAEILAARTVLRGPGHEHDHVYGANLAVRGDAYLAAGGFPHLRTGEDQALVDALADRGHRVVRTRKVGVTTSGRLAGRATGGLACLLSGVDAS